jgi:hypothetical protein
MQVRIIIIGNTTILRAKFQIAIPSPTTHKNGPNISGHSSVYSTILQKPHPLKANLNPIFI